MLTRQALLTPPEPDELRDRRIIAALTPSPIRAHRIASEPLRPFGFHWLVFVVPALLAAFLMMVDPLGRL